MISRVIEAKPEELRVFLEEAAGVSKYKERRKETEGRLADTRENLSRVEDIRTRARRQLARLDSQAQVADAVPRARGAPRSSRSTCSGSPSSRMRCARASGAPAEIATLTGGARGLQADLRAAEARLEALRTEHYAAGDALHEKQGAFYAANAEVTRLEQQLAFARESETRITQQVAQLTEALGALAGTGSGARCRPRGGRGRARQVALTAREQRDGRGKRGASRRCRALEAAVRRPPSGARRSRSSRSP